MAKYHISSAAALLNLVCEAGLPAQDASKVRIAGHIVWEVALSADPEDLFGERGEIAVTLVRCNGGYELTAHYYDLAGGGCEPSGDPRLLRVGGTRRELQTALQRLVGLKPRVIDGGGGRAKCAAA